MERVIKFRVFDNVCQCYVKDNWKFYLNGGVSIESTWATNDVTIEQFTGLHDKNGKEIYEGDVVKVFDVYGEININGTVIFQDGSFCIKSDTCTYYRWIDYDVEITSNIHERG